MEGSKIEWTDHTFNPWWGCMKVSEGCKNCYAENLDNRYHNANPHWGPGSGRKAQSEAYWKQPLKWNAEAEKAGIPAKVFCASMADVFEGHPDTIEYLFRLFQLIEKTPFLTWQLLTKRPENIRNLIEECAMWPEELVSTSEFLLEWLDGNPPANVWLGTSVENQKAADTRIPHLLRVPAAVRFLSCEPLLGPVNLTHMDVEIAGDKKWCWIDALTGRHTDMGRPCPDVPTVQWVIAGGESGHGARPMHPDWAMALRDQCAVAGVPFLFKQWGEYLPACQIESAMPGLITERAAVQFPSPHNPGKMNTYYKIGKKAAGRLLDGAEHNGFPA